MDYTGSAATGLVDFYEQRVLPNLFERLDQAFPEIRWTRTASGWLGEENNTRLGNEQHARRLVCNQPWGFTEQDGTSASWLAYANGGSNPTGGELVKAVHKLAELAGVRDAWVDQPLSRHEQAEAHRKTRYRELLEAFSAYASACLYGPAGKQTLAQLREDYGIRPDQLATTALGIYTDAADVREYLLSVGFSEDEIDASYVTRDSRLTGRVTIPWRDPWGNLRTVVACDLSGKTTGRRSQLFLKGSSRPEFFGLDVALRPASGGRQHLLLVGSLIEVLICHARGLWNVAASGNRIAAISCRQWKTLSSLGVERTTLTPRDEPAAWQRTHESLTHWLDADSRTQPFAFKAGTLGTTPLASGYARSLGNEALLTLSESAPHGCTYLANDIIDTYRTGPKLSDSQVVEILSKAVELDHRVTEPTRAWAMERFFWPTILSAIELDWQDVHGLLKQRQPAALATREETQQIRKYKLLVTELTTAAAGHDTQRCEELILAAADEIRQREKQWSSKPPQPKPMPVLPPVTIPAAEDHWQETLVEAPPITAKSQPTPPPAPPVAKTNGRVHHERPTDESIRRRAYRLWENSGHPAGQHLMFWQEAERQLIAEARQFASSPA
jgi:hypothetical protein